MSESPSTPAIHAIVIGTGGHASVVFEAMQLAGNAHQIIAWVEQPNYTGTDTLHNRPIWREDDHLADNLRSHNITHVVCGLGTVNSNPQRWLSTQLLAKHHNLTLLTVIHPTAIVAPSATIKAGCYVGAGAIIQPHAAIGELCIVNTGSIVEHHTSVGNNTHIAPAAVVCGGVTLGQHCLIGANATIIQGLTIADATTIGAGVTVIKPVAEAGTTVINQTS